MTNKIVLIDDNFAIRQLIKIILTRLSRNHSLDINVFSSDNGVEGLGYVFITDPNIIIVDTTLPKYSGKDIIEFFIQNSKFLAENVHVIVLEENASKKLNLPRNFHVINKSEKNAYKELTKLISEKLNMKEVKDGGKFFHKLANSLFKNGNKIDLTSNKIFQKTGLRRFFYSILRTVIEITTSCLLAIILLITEKPHEDNIVQRNSDSNLYRIKYYPTLVVTFMGFILTFVTAGFFLTSQTFILKNQLKETLASTVIALPVHQDFIFHPPVGGGITFLGPNAVAVNSSGEVLVVDSYNTRVQKFDQIGNYISEFDTYQYINFTTYQTPVGIALDSTDNIFIVDGNGIILKFNEFGVYQTNFGDGDLDYGVGIAIDSNDNIFVSDNNHVSKYNSSGVLQSSWGGWGETNGEFKRPQGIAVDSVDNIYVADLLNHRIQKFSNSGSFLDTFGTVGSGDANFRRPIGIAINPSNGNLIISDSVNDRIKIHTSTGTFVSTWGTFGINNSQFDNPTGIGLDASNNIYVTDHDNNRVQKFNSSGTYSTQWGSETLPNAAGTGDGQFAYPRGIDQDSLGNSYVVDNDNNRIQKFDPYGNYLLQWGSLGSANGQFDGPYDVIVDNQDYIYVTDGSNHRVQKFDSSGNYLTKWGVFASTNGNFKWPTGITADSANNIYVVDSNNHRVQKFTNTGTYVTKWGTEGTGNTQFSYPGNISIDSSDNIYVTDEGNYRISKFTSTGTYITQWGAYGSAQGQFEYLGDVTVDSNNNVYVSDIFKSIALQKFDSSGNFLGEFATNDGANPGQVDWVAGLSYFNNKLYVSEMHNHRIQLFTSVIDLLVVQSENDTMVQKAGYSDDLSINLYGKPSSDVTIDLSSTNSRLTFNPTSLTFTEENYETPQLVEIIAVEQNMGVTETDDVVYTVSSLDTNFDNIVVSATTVDIDGGVAPTDTPTPIPSPAPSPFPTPYTPTNLSPQNDTYIYDTSPTLSFELHAPDTGVSLSYRIRVQAESLIIIDYTSEPGAQGPRSFTVGQADGLGNGTYNGDVGYFGQTLDIGAHTWSVQAIESPGVYSNWSYTTGENFAFFVSSATPTPSPTPTPLSSTYYFDASDATPSQIGSAWFDEDGIGLDDAFDTSTSTYSYARLSSSDGSLTDNYIHGQGTNSPTTGGIIQNVYARIYAQEIEVFPPTVHGAVYSNGLSELLGEATYSGLTPDWGSYAELSIPSGGWTWQKVNDLEIKFYATSIGYESRIYKAEVLVEYSSEPEPTITNTPIPSPTETPVPTTTPLPPDSPSLLGPAMLEGGGFTNDTTPTLNFTLSAPDTGTPLSYNLQILKDAVLIIDYSSEEDIQGIRNFTVGQASGLGTYNNGYGSESQTLQEGEYTWRVMATGSSGDSSWVDANNGNVAFTIDTQSPTEGSVLYTDGYYTLASVPLVLDDGLDPAGINTSTRLIERSSATLTSDVCSTFGTFEEITPTGTYPNLIDNSVTSANCYQYRYTVSDNATNEVTYTSANIAKIAVDAPPAPGVPQSETPTFTLVQEWVWDAAVDTVSGIAQYVWRVVDEFDNTVDSGVSATLNATTNLGVGVYTFFVSALNNAGLLSDESFANITIEPTPTNTPNPTPTETPVPTATNTPIPTSTNTPVPAPTSTPVPTATNTPIPTSTNIPVPTTIPTLAPTSALVINPTLTPTLVTAIPSTTPIFVSDTLTPTDIVLTQTPTTNPEEFLDSPTPTTNTSDSNDGGFFSDFSPKNSYAMPEESVVNHPIVKSVAKSITTRLNQLSIDSSPLVPIVETPLIVAEAIKPITDNVNYFMSLRFVGENTALAGISTTNLLAYVAPAIVTAISQPRILFHALTWFWKRKSKQPWGIVFDKSTGAPVAFARIILTQEGNTVSTQTTDLQGKYGFSANKGKYQLYISHSDYLDFVSDIEVGYDGEIISKDFEVSAKSRDDVNSGIRWIFYRLKKQIAKNLFILNTTLFSIGFVYTLFAITNHLTVINYVILSLYIFQFILMFVFYFFKDKESGQVIDIASGLPVSGAIVRIFDEERQIDIAITDAQGRYSFILEPNTYFIKASANGYVFPSDDKPNIVRDKLGGKLLKFTIQDKQRVNIKIYLRRFASLNANNQAILSPFS